MKAAAVIGLLGMVSCSVTKDVDYRAYEQIPVRTSSKVYRAFLKSTPYTSRNAFYGNYGGPGNLGGVPTDKMDELFRRHDIVYHKAKTISNMLEADRMLVFELKKIDASELTPDGRKFQARVIQFMSCPIAEVVGKPFATLFWREEPEGAYFSDKNSVRAFFDMSQPGFPEKRKEAVDTSSGE